MLHIAIFKVIKTLMKLVLQILSFDITNMKSQYDVLRIKVKSLNAPGILINFEIQHNWKLKLSQ